MRQRARARSRELDLAPWAASAFERTQIAAQRAATLTRGPRGPLCIAPRAGMAVVHFPSTLPAFGGVTDYNVWHEGEAAQDEKWVAQQFIWSHPGLDWRRVLDRENWEPEERRCAVCL